MALQYLCKWMENLYKYYTLEVTIRLPLAQSDVLPPESAFMTVLTLHTVFTVPFATKKVIAIFMNSKDSAIVLEYASKSEYTDFLYIYRSSAV